MPAELLFPYIFQIFELDLSSVTPCCSGPKRPHDKVAVADMKTDFSECLKNKASFKVSKLLLWQT